MPVVKTQEISFNGKTIKRKINCDSKGIFSVDLPEEVVEALHVHKTIKADSLAQIERKWNEFIEKFKSIQTSERKVIACKFEGTANIWRNNKPVFDGRNDPFSDGISISFCAAVYIETTVKMEGDKENKNYKLNNSDIPSSFHPKHDSMWHGRYEDFIIMDWTEEREAAVADLCRRFEELILNLDGLFKDEKKFLKIIENPQRLLPG